MYIQRNVVSRSRNIYTPSIILTAWYHSLEDSAFIAI
jgi:hypothetical protein